MVVNPVPVAGAPDTAASSSTPEGRWEVAVLVRGRAGSGGRGERRRHARGRPGAGAVGMAAGGVPVSALTPPRGHEGALRAPRPVAGVVGPALGVFLRAGPTRPVHGYDG
ncbi:hypothetical protein ACFWTE_10660 [Nocardiopsis sp. NPDC058631]|uniref:hypothetical protein n=1 Tax=Nocardiopsis sp. NPDC058631 TaxID=3346566 RepID=UPI00365160EA